MQGGRDVAPLINSLIPLFPVRIATQDWHPADHISFASNHQGKKPFDSFTTLVNPLNENEKVESRLWPDHCIQNSPGAELIPELDVSMVQHIIKKGTDSTCEMYSGFYSPFRIPNGFGDTGLSSWLKDAEVDEVWVVGLAADYCVQNTAVDAVREGFSAYIIEEATRAVKPDQWKVNGRQNMVDAGVKLVSIEGEEVKALRSNSGEVKGN